MLGWVGGFWLFGTILVLIINATVNDERDYACMGALFSLAGLLPGTLSRGGGSGHVRFRLAVIMGQTRRSFLLWDTAITLLLAGMGVLLSWGLWHVEGGLYRLMYPGYADDLPLERVFDWRVLLLLLGRGCLLVPAFRHGAIACRLDGLADLRLCQLVFVKFGSHGVGQQIDTDRLNPRQLAHRPLYMGAASGTAHAGNVKGLFHDGTSFLYSGAGTPHPPGVLKAYH